jgi:hypothetical protein
MTNIGKKLVLGLLGALFMFEAAAPAAAQPWGWGPPPPRHHRHWEGDRGWGPPPPRWRRHCWTETRRVRVETPWGPRWRLREVRICR